MPNEKHLKIASIVTFVMLAIIFLLCLLSFYFFYPQIKSFANEKILSKIFSKSPEQILSIIRKDVIPSIVEVACADDDSGKETQVGSGIFYYDGTSSVPTVLTNAHVVLGKDGNYHACNIYFPRAADGTFYESSYKTNAAYLYHDLVSSVGGVDIQGLDAAQLVISGPNLDENGVSYKFPPKAPDVFDTVAKTCKKNKDINIGEKVFIIGYPNTGGDSITLTEGVVSGFTGGTENLIKISASTNHGNSGGIAIGQNDGCYYGIVSSATFETGSNLGFVIPANFINSFIENTTGKKTYFPPSTTTKSSTYLKNSYQVLDLALKYPTSWKMATISEDKSELPVYSLTTPRENALDDFNDGIIFKTRDLNASDISESEVIKKQMLTIFDDLDKLGIKDADTQKSKGELANGITSYSIFYFEKTGTLFGLPAYVFDTFFVYKNRLYLITSLAGQGKYEDLYLHMFDEVLNSIKFK